MRKVIKNVVKSTVAVISTLLVLLITLPLLAALLINLSVVQNFVAKKVMSGLSETLGTTVSIDRVQIKLINRVVVDGFYVEDYQGDTLLYVGRLTAPVTDLGLVGGPLTFGKVKLEGTEMWLRRDSTDTMNIKHIVNRIRGDREKNPDDNTRIIINGIEADSLTFGLLRFDKPFREGLDFSRFVIRNTNVRIDDFSIIRDTIRIDIRSISCDERSGFRVDELSAHDLVIAPGAVFLDNARIRAPEADVELPRVRLQGEDWLAFRNFIDSVSVGVNMRRSRFTSGFVGWFVPAVRDWNISLEDVSINTTGPVSSLAGEIVNAHTLGTSLALGFESHGIPGFDDLWLDADVRKIETSGNDIDSLMRNVTGQGLAADVLDPLGSLDRFIFTGRFTGGVEQFTAQGTIDSEAGEVEASAEVRVDGAAGTAIDGRVAVTRLDAGRIFGYGDLGAVSGSMRFNGRVESGESLEAEVEGAVNSLEFRNYTYRGITLEGILEDRMFDGTLHSADRNLDLDFSGQLDFNDSIPRYNFGLDLRRADLAATNLNRTDSVSLLSGRVEASASGSSLDNLNGRIEIVDPVYVSSSDTVRTDMILLTGRNSATSKLLTVESEFAEARFRSRISYREMFDYLGDFLRGYLPLLYADPGAVAPPVPGTERNVADAAHYSVLSLRVNNSDRLLATLLPDLQVAPGSEVSFLFNPFVRSFSLSARSDFIEYKNNLAVNLELNSDNKSDSLTLHLSSEDFYAGSFHIPDVAVHMGAKGRQMNLSTRLENTHENFSALLGLRIDSGSGEGDRNIRFRFTPSYVSLLDRMWYITARSVTYTDSGIVVDSFRVFSEGDATEQLSVDGIISKNPSDTLHVGLDRFDLEPLGRLTEGSGYRIGGRASGYVDFMSLLKGTRMNAGIEFRGLSLNGAQAAPLRFTSFWDPASQNVRFQMLNHRNSLNVLHGTFAPASGVIDAAAEIDSLDLGLLDPLLTDIVENTGGKGNFQLTLGGTFRNLRIDGQVEIPLLETTVSFTQATYILRNAVINVANSRLSLPPTAVSDPYGNSGQFAMSLELSNLRNIGVDIDASVNRMLAFDTGPEANEAFYGQVFATGTLGIRVDNMGTRMAISATIERGTKFHMPLNAKSNISWADFVRFRDPHNADTANVLARKRLIYERRVQGQNRARAKKPFDLNMNVDLTPDAEFHMLIDPSLGNGISAHGRGIINMRVNPATNLFSMVGDCTITDGKFEFSMIDVFNKDFIITPGSTLVWTGEPEDALLNVEAVYRVRASLSPLIGEGTGISTRPVPVECIIRLTERLSQPEITFDIRLPSADTEAQLLAESAMSTQELKSTQFLSLLLIGSFAPGNSFGGQSSGAATSGAVGFDILTSQLSNFLSTEDYNIYFKYRPAQDLSSGSYTGNQYDIGFSKGFIDNRLILEIEGNYVEDRGANSVSGSDLSGDVYLTWVIDRSGNLKLKAFTQTIDRWDENQGLQESGLGIYYKKDFDSVRDIWRRNRDSFTNFGDTGESATAEPSRREIRRSRKTGGVSGTEIDEQTEVKVRFR